MEKITFIDHSAPALEAANLNQWQENTSAAIGEGDSIKVDKATISATGKGYKFHGSSAAISRPSEHASVEWIGSVEPNNAINGDTWVDTTQSGAAVDPDVAVIKEAPLNVKYAEFGAVGNAFADDTAAINAALAAAGTAGGGSVYIPGGIYRVTGTLQNKAHVLTFGDGRDNTTIMKDGSFDLMTYHGVSTGVNNNRCTYSTLRDLTLWGNANTGRLLDCVYADNLLFENLFLKGNQGVGLDIVEVWDSTFNNIALDACNSASQPSLWIRSSRASSGFGSGTDNSNVLRFNNCRSESWKAGGVLIDRGVGGTQDCNHIYFNKMKLESYMIEGTSSGTIPTYAGTISPGTAFRCEMANIIHLSEMYIYMGNFGNGTTPKTGIFLKPGIQASVRDSQIGNGSVNTIEQGLYAFCSTPIHIDGIYGQYTTAPNCGISDGDGLSKHIKLAGAGPYNVGHNHASGCDIHVHFATGVRSTGPGPIMRTNGPPTDSSWGSSILKPYDGIMAYDYTNKKLYIRSGGVWEGSSAFS